MIPLEDSAAVLLCAGLSRRYGSSNKLLALLRGKPLVAHPAALLASLPLRARFAVVPPRDEELRALLEDLGFACVSNPRPERGKDHSIRIGLRSALAAKPRAILLCLGDMPDVEPAHIAALAATADDARPAISAAGDFRAPPAMIPAALAARIVATRELAVREALTGGAEVRTAAAMLLDFDTVTDFERARAQGEEASACRS
jgi:molybdenum cofactor cytidylyltransferase